MRRTIIMLCFICLLSCVEKNPDNRDIIIDELPDDEIITSQELTVPPILFRPVNTCVIDSFLIIAQSRPDSIFSIFILPDCQYLMSFGVKGRGPNEFMNSSPGFTLGPVYSDQASFAVSNTV